MKKKKLEILLEQVTGFKEPDVTKEQYKTPATIASELLYFAYMNGELGGTVFDLGCGTGILGIGAELLGAQRVVCVDSDIKAIHTAQQNAASLNCKNIDFVCCDMNRFCGSADTTIMNPPFGAQVKGSDRIFLKKAGETSNVIYSIHNKGSARFVQNCIAASTITDIKKIKFIIPYTFKFHTKERKSIDAEIYRIEVARA
ncbi:methyltransferase [Methanosarcinales archaeon]|nr:MAG: methyltransferase [Methanosarcinales archaeon]